MNFLTTLWVGLITGSAPIFCKPMPKQKKYDIQVVSDKFSNISFVYSGKPNKYLYFLAYAKVNDKWYLIDNDIKCKQANATYIYSCSPYLMKNSSYVVKFVLSDCEMVYRFKFKEFDKMLLKVEGRDAVTDRATYSKVFYIYNK